MKAPRLYIHLPMRLNPHVPVYSGSGIPSAVFLPGIVNANCDDVLSWFQIFPYVATEGGVAIRMSAHTMPVAENLTVHIYSLKIDEAGFACHGLGYVDGLTIPAFSGGQVSSVISGRFVAVEVV